MSSPDLGPARKVLIVEDELMVADIIEEVLVGAGFQVCGITGSIARQCCWQTSANPTSPSSM